ncbi:MAG: exopolysaccharide biosynthesis protein [Anditalea sp.]
MPDQQHIIDDKITMRELFHRMTSWMQVFKQKWKFIGIAIVLGGILGALASIIKKPVYTAETSFVLEETNLGGIGNMSGIASLLGLDIGSLGSGSGLFEGDNIMELYKSGNMLAKTLLSPFSEKDSSYLLIDRYIDFNKLEKKWADEVDFSQLDFGLAREKFSIQQDSVVKEILKVLKKENLVVDKPDRRLSIIKVAIQSKDESFSKIFNETLVENVNEFYLFTKTKKTGENLSILQMQSDSVRRVLDQSLEKYALLQDQVPNPNPLLQKGTVEAKSSQVDVQASIAVYEEIVKNLEIAKISHRNNSPLIQIIDSPRYPLEESKIKLSVGIVAGAFIFLLLALFYIYLSTIYQGHLQKDRI